MEMTKHDVKNYLEKVYNVPVVEVRTRIGMGRTKRDMKVGYVTKEEDDKFAYVTLVCFSWNVPNKASVKCIYNFQPKEHKFVFPELFPAEAKQQQEDDSKSLDQSKELFKKYQERNKDRPGTPGWFSL